MKHLMFDVDGTLVQSNKFDETCFLDAVYEGVGLRVGNDWESYPYVTDQGILMTLIERQAPHLNLRALVKTVKPIFIRNVRRSLAVNPVQEVPGAKKFISNLCASDEYVVSIATGGWRESALLKLASAGFEIDDLVVASANEHYSRREIMRHAQSQVDPTQTLALTYFGDGEWDVKVCHEMGVNLVIVGDRTPHSQTICDFLDFNRALSFVQHC